MLGYPAYDYMKTETDRIIDLWIERTAYIESSMAMDKFVKIVQVDLNKLDEKQKDHLKKQCSELIELYTFLKGLRVKLEQWDCRYGIDGGKA